MMAGARCVVKGCANRSDQGTFVGDICSPCHLFLMTGRGTTSAVFRLAATLFSRRIVEEATSAQLAIGEASSALRTLVKYLRKD
jgi:hypothetical protein